MGVVYAARDRELDREVALKVIAPEVADADSATRLRREARIIARLEHPGIVPVHDVGTLPDGRVFYAMKLVERAAARRPRARGPPLARAAAPVPAPLRAGGLRARPRRDPPRPQARERDGGPVRRGPGDGLGGGQGAAARPQRRRRDGRGRPAPAPPRRRSGTAHGTVLGTPAYMAAGAGPRRGRARRTPAPTSTRSAAILYFLLTGRAPGAAAADPAQRATRTWAGHTCRPRPGLASRRREPRAAAAARGDLPQGPRRRARRRATRRHRARPDVARLPRGRARVGLPGGPLAPRSVVRRSPPHADPARRSPTSSMRVVLLLVASRVRARQRNRRGPGKKTRGDAQARRRR